MGEQQVEAEEGELQRDHRGCEHRCTAVRATSPGNPRETFPRDLWDFRMLYINSYAALIFRAVLDNKYSVCIKHVLILQ